MVLVNLMPWDGWSKATWTTDNTGIANIAATTPNVTLLDIATDPTLSVGCNTSGVTISCTYDDVNRCNSGGARGHLTATGENYLSGLLAPILLSFKR